MLLRELFERYINEIELELKGTTLDSKMYRFKKINSKLGDMNIEDISPAIIKTYQKELLYEEKLSADYINRLIGTLKQMLEFAREEEYIKTNPLKGVKKIKEQYTLEKKDVVWTIETYSIFRKTIDCEMDRLIFDCLFYLGMRKGELVALKWQNVDFISKELYINSTAVQRVGIGQIVTTPKTNNSNRTIALHDSLVKDLRNYYLKQKEKFGIVNNLYIFGGDKMISFSALDRKYAKYIKLSKVPKIKLHGLRHSHATMLATCTSDIKSIAERLGDTIEVVTSVYIHSTTQAQRELARLVDEQITNNVNERGFEEFKGYLEKVILKELSKDRFNQDETTRIIKAYNLLKKI